MSIRNRREKSEVTGTVKREESGNCRRTRNGIGMTLTLLLAVLLLAFPAFAETGSQAQKTQAVTGTWKEENGKWTFYYDGKQAKSCWLLIRSSRDGSEDSFYFNAEGIMQTGWQKSGSGNWYHLRTEKDSRYGAKEKGLFRDSRDGRYYYLDPDTGAMKTGWINVDGTYRYFTEDCSVQTWFWDASSSSYTYNALYGRPIGSMYMDEITPDGWRVGSDGSRIAQAFRQ